VSLSCETINTANKTHKKLSNANTTGGLEVGAQKSKYMLISLQQNEGQNHNKSFSFIGKLKYYEMTVT
jgi:hypothetical protein